MPRLILIAPDGRSHDLDIASGTTVMQAAVNHGVAGIIGECGGSGMCATCHVLVDEDWRDRLPAPLATEDEMLDCTAAGREPGSRLGCQITIDETLDGLTARLPTSQ